MSPTAPKKDSLDFFSDYWFDTRRPVVFISTLALYQELVGGGGGGVTCICRDTGMCHYFGYFFGLLPDFGVLFGLFPDFWVSFFGKI